VGAHESAGGNGCISQSGTGTSPDASSTQSGASGQGNNQVFGGGPIVGVASLSKDNTIREFNHKKKYNEWQFVYRSHDRPRRADIDPVPAGAATLCSALEWTAGQHEYERQQQSVRAADGVWQ